CSTGGSRPATRGGVAELAELARLPSRLGPMLPAFPLDALALRRFGQVEDAAASLPPGHHPELGPRAVERARSDACSLGRRGDLRCGTAPVRQRVAQERDRFPLTPLWLML